MRKSDQNKTYKCVKANSKRKVAYSERRFRRGSGGGVASSVVAVALRSGRRLLRGPQVHLRPVSGRSRGAHSERLLRRQRRLQVLVAARTHLLRRLRCLRSDAGGHWRQRRLRLA